MDRGDWIQEEKPCTRADAEYVMISGSECTWIEGERPSRERPQFDSGRIKTVGKVRIKIAKTFR